jgi:hypothetical protein
MIKHAGILARFRSFALVAGLLALALQVLAPVLPQAAMANAMVLAAASPEEAASFAATCLGFGNPVPGDTLPADHQAKCPICLGIAQAQGAAPITSPLAIAIAWERLVPVLADTPAPTGLSTRAFASRAPPLA